MSAPDDIRVLLLRAAETELMVPAAAVAEILRSDILSAAPPGSPPWLAGLLDWRGCRVPVARLSPSDEVRKRRLHAVVCFAPSADPALPFLAVESLSLPQLLRATPENLVLDNDERPALPLFTLAAVRLGDRAAWLADLDALERALL
jgi:hypothetical protein